MMEWVPLLIAVALGAFGGISSYSWYLKSKANSLASNGQLHSSEPELGRNYFRGINYLLNEQPDKALEVFLQLAEVTPETLETHLALGSLFRRRGEMDNAIRCHQNIIKQDNLSNDQRHNAMLELGEDYLRAGLLDRAEDLFASLAENQINTETALKRLLNIFQQEREWLHAIHVAEQLSKNHKANYQETIAQFYCELAEQSLRADRISDAVDYLNTAKTYQASCARVEIIFARIAKIQGDNQQVIRHLQQALEYDADTLPIILDDLMEAYRAENQVQQAAEFLNGWLTDNTDTSAVVAFTNVIHQLGDHQEALARAETELSRQPTTGKLAALVSLHQHASDESQLPMLDVFERLVGALKLREDGFQCRICGLQGHTHHWHCPSCRHWDTTKPVRGILGE